MYIKNKQQILIFVAASVMIAGFVLVSFLPMHKKAGAIRSQKDLTELMINDVARQSDKLPQLKDQLETMRSQLKLQQSFVPEQVELGQFLQTITSIMNEYKLQEQFVKPGAEKKIDQLWAVPIDIRCKGQLSQMFDFFKSLQNLERLIRIENISLSNSPDLNGQLSMETKAVIYYKATKAKS